MKLLIAVDGSSDQAAVVAKQSGSGSQTFSALKQTTLLKQRWLSRRHGTQADAARRHPARSTAASITSMTFVITFLTILPQN